MTRNNYDTIEKIKSNCDVVDGPLETPCWVWKGCNSGKKQPHGRVRYMGPKQAVHRLTYQFARGPIPKGKVIRHMCNNSLCCNPDHLKMGTQKDNMKDCIKAGRHVSCLNQQAKDQVRQ